jgi:hypothetical protein
MKHPAPTSLTDCIAQAIKKADTSYVFEDYTRQARAVIVALRAAGYEVVPAEPPDGLVEEAADALPSGRLNKPKFLFGDHFK